MQHLEESHSKLQEGMRKGRHDICGVSRGLARRHNGGLSMERGLGLSLGSSDAVKPVGEMCNC